MIAVSAFSVDADVFLAGLNALD
ncbi:uncharacterized protein METZ01_LOCUS473594, partial [marine metagenome]